MNNWIITNSAESLNIGQLIYNLLTAIKTKAKNLSQIIPEHMKEIYHKLKMFLSFDFFLIQLYCYFGHQLLQQIIHSKSLEDDDKVFLKNYIAETKDTASARKQKESFLWCLYPVIAIILLHLWCLFSPVAAMLLMNQNFSLIRLIIKCYILLIVVVLAVILWRMLLIQHTIGCILAFIRKAEDSSVLLKKSLRLIQEVELVRRGFTLVSTQMSMLKSEQSSDICHRLYPELRQLIFLTARFNMLSSRKSTILLLEQINPLIEEIDTACTYLAKIPLEDYGPSLQPLEEKHKNLNKLTDDFSITALKAMLYLYSMQQSEFLRRLALCFCINALPESQRGKHNSSINDIVSHLKCELKNNYEKLKSSYEFHRSGFQEHNSKSFPCSQKPANSPISELFTSVHSLDLHLQAALHRSSGLSFELERFYEDEVKRYQNDRNEQDGLEDIAMKEKQWYDQLQVVKAELEACQACWDIGLDKFDKIFKRKKGSVPKLETKVNEKQDKKKPSVPLEEFNPVIVDEVFEGFTDQEVDDFQCNYVRLSAEEREKKIKDLEESRRMMFELKSVIAVRAVDRERREDIAVKRQKEGKEPCSPSLSGSEAEQSEDSLQSDSLQCDLLSKTEADPMQQSGNLSEDLLDDQDVLAMEANSNLSETKDSNQSNNSLVNRILWSRSLTENLEANEEETEPFFLHQHNDSTEIDCDIHLRNLLFSPLPGNESIDTDNLQIDSFQETIDSTQLISEEFENDLSASKIDCLDQNDLIPTSNDTVSESHSQNYFEKSEDSYHFILHPEPQFHSGSPSQRELNLSESLHTLDGDNINDKQDITISSTPPVSEDSFFLHEAKDEKQLPVHNLQGTNLIDLEERLLAREESSFLFARNVAALASARCKEKFNLNIQTFGDSETFGDNDSFDESKESNNEEYVISQEENPKN